MNSQGLVLLAGGIAFTGSFKEAEGFPGNGYAIIGGTTALAFLASLANDTAIGPAVKSLGVLMVLAAVYRYVPGLSKTNAKTDKIRKAKTNG